MIKRIAMTFGLAVALVPSAAIAQYYGPAGPPGAAPFLMPQRSARAERPSVGRIPREDENIPPISRDPNDCVKTICTCLRGGGC